MWIFRSEPWQFSNEKTRLLALFGSCIRTRGALALRGSAALRGLQVLGFRWHRRARHRRELLSGLERSGPELMQQVYAGECYQQAERDEELHTSSAGNGAGPERPGPSTCLIHACRGRGVRVAAGDAATRPSTSWR